MCRPAELLADGTAGVLILAADVSAWTQKLQTLMGDEGVRQRFLAAREHNCYGLRPVPLVRGADPMTHRALCGMLALATWSNIPFFVLQAGRQQALARAVEPSACSGRGV